MFREYRIFEGSAGRSCLSGPPNETDSTDRRNETDHLYTTHPTVNGGKEQVPPSLSAFFFNLTFWI